jgi:hypothetical protein
MRMFISRLAQKGINRFQVIIAIPTIANSGGPGAPLTRCWNRFLLQLLCVSLFSTIFTNSFGETYSNERSIQWQVCSAVYLLFFFPIGAPGADDRYCPNNHQAVL